MEAKASGLIVNPDIVDDPTLQKRNVEVCKNPYKNCNNKEVVCFNHITLDKFDMIYMCTQCRHHWAMGTRDPKYDIDTDTEEDEEVGKV